MTDFDKMINELTFQLYSKEVVEHHDPIQLSVTDANKILELLKEQEPAEAKTMGESKSYGSWWFACGACGHAIDPEDNYCRECGKAVKWDD